MKKNKSLDTLLANKEEYDKESQDLIAGLNLSQKEINTIEAMKRSEGWKILDKKIREELKERIEIMVKDDPKIQVLLGLLKVADTKELSKLLDESINSLLPD